MRRYVHTVADSKVTPCEIEPGVVVKLSATLHYQDVPPGAVIAIAERECERLAHELLVTRMAPVGADAPV